MKTHLQKAFAFTAVIFILVPTLTLAQVPSLGTAANFVLFTTDGAVKNENAASQLTGNVGTNNGSSTGFGNIDGRMHDGGASIQASADLLIASGQLNSTTPTRPTHAALMGGGETLVEGVYSIPEAVSLSGLLILTGTSSSVFIFKIGGALSIASNSEISLTGGVSACNVFWQVNGAVNIATGTKMKGTVIATNAAIYMIGVILEGRALSIAGAITVDGVTARVPIGCGVPNPSPNLTGPTPPVLNSTECYVLFSGNGAVTNSNASATFTGDIGTNLGLTTGFSNVTGTVHPTNDVSTAACASALGNVYTYLNTTLPYDIELLYPAQFGNNLVLTPHTYRMNGATTFTGNLYLNAQGNSNAVFVLQINSGALSTSTGARVILMNEALAKNVYWKITGAVSIESSSQFKGTIVSTAAIDLKTLVVLDGRALTTLGSLTTAATSAIMPPGCTQTAINPLNDENSADDVTIYPNPFSTSVTIMINEASKISDYELRIFNVLGTEVIKTPLTQQSTTIETGNLRTGIYFYRISGKNKKTQSGKLVSQ
jgi:Ice-binding-like/Secretion system C-terminal sorting domain